MRYLSVCSGIEAATVAWHPLGWTPVAFSEIEKFPSAVLRHHYPDVRNWGDMNEFRQWPDASFDVLVGGTPCQSFSVAGLRKGLADPRGNLALVYLAIADRYRPRWLVWENVPGVLSSDGGRDFGSIVGAMVELGYGCSWRVLDAQYFGVPQRRRRVFLVGHLGDWRSSAEVLFEPESLLRNPAPCRKTRERIAPSLAARTRGGGGLGTGRGTPLVPAWPADVAATMNTAFADKQGLEDQHALAGASYFVPSIRDEVIDKAGALSNQPGMKQQTYVAFTASDRSNKPAWESDIYPTLNAQVPNDTSNLQMGVRSGMSVRRLTPLECTRLQGFPDDYFDDVPGRSDSQVYKALGNSMAVPVMSWIGRRIKERCNV